MKTSKWVPWAVGLGAVAAYVATRETKQAPKPGEEKKPAPEAPKEIVEERGVAEDASPALPPGVADEAPTTTDKPEPPSSAAISIPDDIRFEPEADEPGPNENDDVDSGEGDGVA